MTEKENMGDYLKKIQTLDLWAELGRRFNLKYGKIQMAFHAGRPSPYADLDVRVNIEQEQLRENCKV